MEQFKIRPSGYKEIRKQIRLKTLPVAAIAVAAGIGISYFNLNNQANVMQKLIPITLAAVVFGLYRGSARQKKIFESYCLTIGETGIVREQENTPTISIPYAEINDIIKNSNGSFTIKGGTALDIIGVPAQIDNHERLEAILNQIRPVKIISNKPIAQKFRVFIIFLPIGLFAVVHLASNKIIIGVCGTALSAILIYSIFQIKRSKNIDAKTRQSSNWAILVLFVVVAMTIFKLLAK